MITTAKKGKHHTLCDIIMTHLKNKQDHKNNKHFYDIIKEEHTYYLNQINENSQLPIEGECDVTGIRITPKKRYGVVIEVKSSNSTKKYRKACLQLAKDKKYFQQLYELDKVFCVYVYGNPKDKTFKEINYEWINSNIIDNIQIK